jgi:hypothetical protein
MGAPGIEAGPLGSTKVYYGPLRSTTTTGFQGFPGYTFYFALLWPPTYEPRTSHHYKRASAHE